jgi:MFS family permease
MKKRSDKPSSKHKELHPHPIIEKKIENTLSLSVKEGAFAAASTGLGPSYIGPFAIAMQATSTQIGMLTAIASLVPSLGQLYSTKLIEKYTRKQIIITALLMMTLLYIPIAITAILYFNSFPYVITTLTILTALLYLISGVVHPAWFSLMGSLVPSQTRGEYFALRTKLMQIAGLLTLIGSAIFLDVIKKYSSVNVALEYTLIGFMILFSLSLLAKIWTIVLISKHYEPKLKIKKHDRLTFGSFMKNLKSSSFGRFTIFNTVLRIAVGIASPFFVIYILKQHNYAYTWWIATLISSILSQIIFLRVIGKISDRYGNILLTKISTVLIALTPLSWALSYYIHNPLYKILYIVLFAQILNGFGWAGFELSMNNFVYDSMPLGKRGYAIAYMNVLMGLGMFVGAGIGTALTYFAPVTIDIIITIFIISFILRISTAFFGIRYLSEVRKVKKFNPTFLIHEFHPLKDTLTEIQHLNHIGTRVIHHV